MDNIPADVPKEGLPDFIIIGAPKCGTSALHLILTHHPDVFIPDTEVYFFDIDEIAQHPEFFLHHRGQTLHDFEQHFPAYLDWYKALFEGAKPGQLIGEDSTTYLSSQRAAQRIERVLPDAKLVVMLRDPVSRAYSQYWHNVRRGRISTSFENKIKYDPWGALRHGYYAQNIVRFKPQLDAGKLMVVFFEDFVSDKKATMARICEHIGLDAPPSDEVLDLNPNPSRTPRNIPMRLAINPVLRPLLASRRNLPGIPGYKRPVVKDPGQKGPLVKAVARAEKLLPVRKPPPMKAETRAFLEGVYAKENAGLSELIGEDVAARWSYMAGR